MMMMIMMRVVVAVVMMKKWRAVSGMTMVGVVGHVQAMCACAYECASGECVRHVDMSTSTFNVKTKCVRTSSLPTPHTHMRTYACTYVETMQARARKGR
jgi:hypothetical protein